MRTAPLTAALLLLLCMLAALALGSPVAAQPSVRTLTPDQLPGLPRAERVDALPEALAAALVRLRVEPRRQPWITPVGDPALQTFAVLVQIPAAEPDAPPIQALIAPSFALRDAAALILLHEGERLPTRVVRDDPDAGFAALELPAALRARLKPIALLPDERDAESLIAALYTADGRIIGSRALLGEHGEEALAFYRALPAPLLPGVPIASTEGRLVAIVALTQPAEGRSWALDHTAIRAFLGGAEPHTP